MSDETETLYKALSRPALLFGLPYYMVLIITIVSSVLGLYVNIFFGYGLGFVFIKAGYWFVKDDYNLLNIFSYKLLYSSRTSTHAKWGANSYDPN